MNEAKHTPAAKVAVKQFDRILVDGREVEVDYLFSYEGGGKKYAHLKNDEDVSAYQDEMSVNAFLGIDSQTGAKVYERGGQ
jgi:hypothetical protein